MQSGELSGVFGMPINQGSAEEKHFEMKVVLHAFIKPAHWGKADKDLTVEVRTSLDWTKNGAKVHFERYVRIDYIMFTY